MIRVRIERTHGDKTTFMSWLPPRLAAKGTRITFVDHPHILYTVV